MATAGKIWRLSTTGVYGPDGTETNGRRGRESFAERNQRSSINPFSQEACPQANNIVRGRKGRNNVGP